MLTDAEIEHIAKLGRIELLEGDVEKFKRELSSILGYVQQLQAIDTSSVEPMYQTTGVENAIRADEPRNAFPMDTELSALLVGQAPMKEERFVKVRSVLKK